jgi:hypothetical protein
MSRSRTAAAPPAKDFDQQLAAARAALPLSGQAAAGSDVVSVARSLGTEVGAFGQATAKTLEEGGDTYAGLPSQATAVREKVGRLKRLEGAREAVTEWLGEIKQEIAFTRVAIGGDVTLALQTTDAVLQNPATPAATRRRVVDASQELRALRDGRGDRRRLALERTRSLKTGFADTQAETSGENTALKEELAQARLEIQYLSGEQLRPSDLGAPASATAPAGRRRRPR